MTQNGRNRSFDPYFHYFLKIFTIFEDIYLTSSRDPNMLATNTDCRFSSCSSNSSGTSTCLARFGGARTASFEAGNVPGNELGLPSVAPARIGRALRSEALVL